MILDGTSLVALLALPNSNMREEKMNSGLSFKNRLMYPVVNGISGSLSCIPFSKAQDPGFQNSYSPTWGDKRSHRAKLQMAYCGEKKQNGWKCTKTQPTDLICWDGFCTSLSLKKGVNRRTDRRILNMFLPGFRTHGENGRADLVNKS